MSHMFGYRKNELSLAHIVIVIPTGNIQQEIYCVSLVIIVWTNNIHRRFTVLEVAVESSILCVITSRLYRMRRENMGKTCFK